MSTYSLYLTETLIKEKGNQMLTIETVRTTVRWWYEAILMVVVISALKAIGVMSVIDQQINTLNKELVILGNQ